MISPEIIEEIRNKADIVAVISEYVPLKKRGKNYLGLCPFHAEKTPSFTVSPEKQLFHCFGCNEGGNVFTFLMKSENLSFAEAAVELGNKVGISIPNAAPSPNIKNEKEKLYPLLAVAAKFYQEQLGLQGEAVQAYLAARKITPSTIKAFQLGFAPPEWDNLFKHLISRGFAPEAIEKAGLTLPREGAKSGYYDRFRNRLMFPILDHRGRTLAFGGRVLNQEEPKYLNSPETPIYHKGETLFGLNLSKDAIKKSKTAVLVEGYFDLLTPFQAGFKNLAATLGTALTEMQCKLLARHAETVILAFDADSAGSTAAERSVELLRKEGLKVKIALIHSGKDPDEMIKAQGATAFLACLESAFPYLEFKLQRIAGRHHLNDIEGKAKALRETVELLAKVADRFVQKEYLEQAARLLKINPETISMEIKRQEHREAPAYRRFSSLPPPRPSSKVAEAGKSILSLAAQDSSALKIFREEMRVNDFFSPEEKNIAQLLLTADFPAGQSPAHYLLNNLTDEATLKFLSKILISEHLAGNDYLKILKDCISVVKKESHKTHLEDLKKEILEAEKAGNAAQAAQLLTVLKNEISTQALR